MAQPTEALQGSIQLLHQALVDEQDPKHMATLGTCLQKMMQVQSEIMQGGGGAPAQNGAPPAPPGAGYDGGGSPPAGPQTAADPRAAMAAMMGG